MSKTICIADRLVGRDQPPFVIAEMSGNHNQSLARALDIVSAAAKSGAHGLKIQTYTPDTMTLDMAEREFRISDPASPWTGSSLYELYGKAQTPWEWHQNIFERARSLGMVPFSTPFDETAVAFLETLNVPCYKIASFENTDLPLIRRVAATGKPLIISTGMATAAELDEAVRAARQAGCQDLILLKCTSEYPAPSEDANIQTIPHLRELFQCEVGISDHTMGVGVSVASVALGATVIEKHFTIRRTDGGPDSAFSMEPGEFEQLVTETERAWRALGKISYGPSEKEIRSLVFRRSLYVTRDMRKGEPFGPNNLRAIRPGYGLPPKCIEQFIGKRASRNIRRGSALAWDMLDATANNDK